MHQVSFLALGICTVGLRSSTLGQSRSPAYLTSDKVSTGLSLPTPSPLPKPCPLSPSQTLRLQGTLLALRLLPHLPPSSIPCLCPVWTSLALLSTTDWHGGRRTGIRPALAAGLAAGRPLPVDGGADLPPAASCAVAVRAPSCH